MRTAISFRPTRVGFGSHRGIDGEWSSQVKSPDQQVKMVDDSKSEQWGADEKQARNDADCTTLEWETQLVRQKLETLRSTLLGDFERRVTCLIDELLMDIRQQQQRQQAFQHFGTGTQATAQAAHTWHNRQPMTAAQAKGNATLPAAAAAASTAASSKTHAASNASASSGQVGRPAAKSASAPSLPDKVFVARESYLTALLQVDHMKTIYHIFYIILMMFLLNTLCYDYFVEGSFNFGLGTFKRGLARLHWVAGVWLLQHVFVLLLYYAFCGWARVRAKLGQQSALRRFWSHSCLIVYISAQLSFCYVATSLCLRFDLPFITGTVLLIESTRLLMKMHAFVRYNAARVLAGKLKATSAGGVVPPFSCYLYFLFAPTLVYRDQYPRTAHIRWLFALNRLLEVVCIAFLYSFIHERHIRTHFQHFGRERVNAPLLIVKFFGMLLPSTVIFLSGFYMILHSWLNFTSELLRFGDRMFYKDWWTAHTYEAFYRNWNVVVHDWLYEYVYRDMYAHVCRRSKVCASLMVFFISALVHEQVIGVALQVFFPALFVLFFGVGVSLVFLTRKAAKNFGNLFLWFSLVLGSCCLISLYSMEYFARQNCRGVPPDGPWLDRLVPAIWRCYAN